MLKLAKFSGIKSESLEKEKENFPVVFTYSIKQTCEIRKSCVAFMQQRLRNAQERDACQELLFLYCFSAILVVFDFVVG